MQRRDGALNGSPFQDQLFTIGPFNVHGEPHISTASGTACVWPHADASSLSMMTVTTVMMTAAGRKRLTERDPTSYWRASQQKKKVSIMFWTRNPFQMRGRYWRKPVSSPVAPRTRTSSQISINRFGQLTIFVDFNDEPFRMKSKIREKKQDGPEEEKR
jgi:hypothetical protein